MLPCRHYAERATAARARRGDDLESIQDLAVPLAKPEAFAVSLQSRVAPIEPAVAVALENARPPFDAVDLRPYVDLAPVTVPTNCPVERATLLFKALGIRHLTVLKHNNQVAGILTRKDILLPRPPNF